MSSLRPRSPFALALSSAALLYGLAPAAAQITGITDSRIQACFKSQAAPPTGSCLIGYGLATGPGGCPTCAQQLPAGGTTFVGPSWLPPAMPTGGAPLSGIAGTDWVPFDTTPFIFSVFDSGILGTNRASASVSMQAKWWTDGTIPTSNTAYQQFYGLPEVLQDAGAFGAAWLVVNWSVDYSVGASGLSPRVRNPAVTLTGTILPALPGATSFTQGKFTREYWRVDPGLPPVKLGEEQLPTPAYHCVSTPGPFSLTYNESATNWIPTAFQAGPFTLRVIGRLELQADPATIRVVPAGDGTPSPDNCGTPSLLAGSGPYPFDNSSSTSAAQGQNEAECSFFGSTMIDHDAWYCWTAPSSGVYDVSTVGSTSVDTKIAVYSGCGCPVAPALACNDDACGAYQSTATFQALAGASYTIQLGTFPGANGGAGSFEIRPSAAALGCTLDDGSSENPIGLTSGGKLLWLQAMRGASSSTVVSSVSTAFGSPTLPGSTPPVGTPIEVCVYEDPNDDGDPSDAILVSQTVGVVGHVDHDVFDTYSVPPAFLNGAFFVGVALSHGAGQYPAPLDTSFCGGAPAWAVGSNSGVLDFQTLTNNSLPPSNITDSFGGVWLLRAGCTGSSGVSFCDNGDPNRIPCPCGNNGSDPDAGCANSVSVAGARVSTTGFTLSDDVVLHSTRMSGSICIFFCTFGPQQPNGAVFGDGVTCTGGILQRLRGVSFPGGPASSASFPVAPETITLSARCGTFPGSGATLQYSSFYRNAAAAFCPPATFNTANTIEITW